MKSIRKWLDVRKRKKELAKAPKDLDSAVMEILTTARSEDLAQFAKEPEDAPGARFHFTQGMAMRNAWGLWEKDQPLTKWFRDHRIWHADDMSAIIYKSLWCKLNHKKFDIYTEAAYYIKFWLEQGIAFDGETIEDRVKRNKLNS